MRPLLTAEARMLAAAWRALLRRPLRPADVQGQRFSVLGKGTYKKTVTVLLVLLAVEAPAVHLLLGALMEPTLSRTVAQAVMLVSSLYLAVWVLGDLRLLRESAGVVVTAEAVVFDVGQRAQGVVPREHIAQALAEPPSDPIAGTPGAARVTPMPPPNTTISLHTPAVLRGVYGLRKQTRAIDLYVDDPAALAAALNT